MIRKIAVLAALFAVLIVGSASARSCGACGPGGDNCIHGNWGYYCIHDFPSGCYMYEDDLCNPGSIPGIVDPNGVSDDTAYNPKKVTDLEVSDDFYASGHTMNVYARYDDGSKALIHVEWKPVKRTWAMSQLKTIYR